MNAPAAPRKRRFDSSSLGALANTGASAFRLAVQLILLPVLARLIGPSEYGLVALAMPVILLANVIADGGLVQALGRLPSASKTVESTAFWVTVGVGVVLAALCCASAFPIGWSFHQPRLPFLILALSPILLMNSATAVFNGRIIRERRFGTFAMGDLLSTFVGAVVALLAATHGFGAWSLVVQQLALWVTKFTWITTRGRASVGFEFRFAEVRELMAFGANNIGATIADWVSKNIDNMIIGGVLGATSLGFYAMAYQVIRVPDMLISGPFWFYIFTAMSRAVHRRDHDAIEGLARAGLRLGAIALAPLFCGLALVADLLASVILGPRWEGAIGPLRLLPLAGFGFALCSLIASMMMGLGKAALQLRLSFGFGLVTIVAVAGGSRFGLDAACAALSVGVVAVMAYYLHHLAKAVETSRLGLLRALLPAAIGCVALAFAVTATRVALASAAPVVVLLAAMVAGGVAYGAVILAIARRQILSDAREFSRAHGEAPPSDAEEKAKAAHIEVVETALSPAG